MSDLQGTLKAIEELRDDLYATKPTRKTVWGRPSSEREPDYVTRCDARILLRKITGTSEFYSARYLAATAVGISVTPEEMSTWVRDLTDKLSDPMLSQDAVEDARKLNDLVVGRNREVRILVEKANLLYPQETGISCMPDDGYRPESGFSNTQKALLGGGVLTMLVLGYAAKRYAAR